MVYVEGVQEVIVTMIEGHQVVQTYTILKTTRLIEEQCLVEGQMMILQFLTVASINQCLEGSSNSS